MGTLLRGCEPILTWQHPEILEVDERLAGKPFLEERRLSGPQGNGLRLYIVGYEGGVWRLKDWVKHTFRNHLATFGLSYSEYQDIDYGSAAKKMANAAKQVYETEKYGRRGEFGELFLHGILIDFFDAEPAVSKIFYLDAANETAKGFDSVHVVAGQDGLSLWLGEAKLYKSGASGVDEAVKSVEAHMADDYLRSEFLAITNKIDRAWPRAEELAELLDDVRSLDEIIEKIKIPILVTYDSDATNEHDRISEAYLSAVEADANGLLERLRLKISEDFAVEVLLLLIPVTTVDEVRKACDDQLRVYQAL